jgi:hypothetical protein
MGVYAFPYQDRAAGNVIPPRLVFSFGFAIGALMATNVLVLAWVMTAGG